MRLLVDAQLPPALSYWLSDRGHEASHVAQAGLASATDAAIWDYAVEIGALIVTKNEDFAYRRVRADAGPGVIWIRLGNARTSGLLAWFERALPEIEAYVARGETIIEVY